MPIISRIGARSIRVRMIYGAMFLLLALGAVTMIYPFMMMLSGSVKSDADSVELTPYPRFWFDDLTLFQKYIESKYNFRIESAQRALWRQIGIWRNIKKPSEQQARYLDDFLAWRKQCTSWWLGHSHGWRIFPENARRFRKIMYSRFDGNLDDFNAEMALSLRYWNGVAPPSPPTFSPFRFPPHRKGAVKAFMEFAETRPVHDRIFGNPDGDFFDKFLLPTYTKDIENYNKEHGTSHSSYQEVFLAGRVPPKESARQRQDWEHFVRGVISLEYVHLSPALAGSFRRFLSTEKYADIDEYNSSHNTFYGSFAGVRFPTSMPSKRSDQIDWEAFIKKPGYCPAERIEIYGPRQAFEEFVAGRRGKSVDEIAPVRMPVLAADWHDCMARAGELRWEFSTRNYKHVLEYILHHGNGIRNTIIYCALSIGLALIVNPLAAYGLSRYRPPLTYTVLLFCMATMAFPSEVAMIPRFLLMKRFPLWPLVGGSAAFGVTLWVSTKTLRNLSEIWRMVLALGVGLLAGFWAVPAMLGRPHISLLNTFAALVLPSMANGYIIFLLKGFFDSIPRELYEAADIDGASEWTKFWSFTMSLSRPILAVIALQAFVSAYSTFMMALIIIPDQKMWTIMVWIFQLQSGSHQSVVYASLVIAAVPTFIMFLLCQGVIMRGIIVPVEK